MPIRIGGIEHYVLSPIPPWLKFLTRELKTNWQSFNPGHHLGRSRDHNGDDDGSGAIDILARGDNGGSRKRRNSKVCLAGIRG
jgi:hypothetical protein